MEIIPIKLLELLEYRRIFKEPSCSGEWVPPPRTRAGLMDDPSRILVLLREALSDMVSFACRIDFPDAFLLFRSIFIRNSVMAWALTSPSSTDAVAATRKSNQFKRRQRRDFLVMVIIAAVGEVWSLVSLSVQRERCVHDGCFDASERKDFLRKSVRPTIKVWMPNYQVQSLNSNTKSESFWHQFGLWPL